MLLSPQREDYLSPCFFLRNMLTMFSSNCWKITLIVCVVVLLFLLVPLPQQNPGTDLIISNSPEIKPRRNIVSLNITSQNYTKYLERSAYIHDNFCTEQSHHPVSKVKTPEDLINMSPELGLFWCPIFKAGSSQWVKLFCGNRNPTHISRSEYDAMMKSKDLNCNVHVLRAHNMRCKSPRQACVTTETSFMVVRDPMARFLSAYTNKWELANSEGGYWEKAGMKAMLKYRDIDTTRYKKNPAQLLLEARHIIRTNHHMLHLIIANIHRNRSYNLTTEERELIHNSSNPYLNPPGPTLRELVKWALSGGHDPHIVPYYKYCAPCTLNYVILRLDKFPDEALELLDLVGHTEYKPQLAHQFEKHDVSGKTTDCMVRYFRTLSTEDFREMYEKFWRVDCELYQYPCKDMYEKVLKLGPSNEDFVLC